MSGNAANSGLIVLRSLWLGLTLAGSLSLGIPHAHADETNAAPKLTPEQLDFFEKKIRPVFVEDCYKCHSHQSEKIKGKLLLDTRDGLLKGGEDGVVIVPGDPEKSMLIKAVRYKDKDLQMPPNDELDPSQVSDLEAWVKMGAPDPRTGADDSEHKYTIDMDKARKHWAFQPVTHPAAPNPTDPDHWAQTPIDNFILATLNEKGLTPSPRADKVTLLRRATFDLIGLPPTPKELDDFLADNSPDAFAKVVDRLLASPHYGERWGRHWLDVTHFADTRGTQGNNRDDRYPYSYVYRDYVIRAFNEDLPYDQFLMQQIAADKLPLGDDKRPLAALGFLTLGNRISGQPNDIIDDRIDVIGKGTMGLTLGCARCHDHKFDPIPTGDYYALHGVLNSSVEPKEDPLLAAPADTADYRAFCREFAMRQGALDAFHDDMTKKLKTEMIGRAGEYMHALYIYKRNGTNSVSRSAFMEKQGLVPQIANFWDNYLTQAQKRHNPVFAPFFAFAQLPETNFLTLAPGLAAKFYANVDKAKPINAVIAQQFADAPESMADVCERYGAVFKDTEQRWQEALADYQATHRGDTNAPAEPKGLTDRAQEQVRQLMYAQYSPMAVDEQRLNNFINRDNKLKNKYADLDKAVTDLVITHPGSPPRAPVLDDAPKPKDSYVMIKGNPGNRGPVVTRHFLTIIAGDNAPPFKIGSGRLELAQDIASKDNPLTARVMINRIWLNHFGEGLVRTPDDFGTRGEPPSHPELLDYLASRFMDDGWSIKKMHRLIMLSSVYQQSSDDNPRYAQIDPENRWLWRMNRRQLDFESFRDTILSIGGDLDLTLGGRWVRQDVEPFSLRRTVYGFVDRKNVPNVYQAFNFASPDLTTGKRETSAVPQQALFMMNNPLVVEQARNVVRRADFKEQLGPEARIDMLYKLIYQRSPTDIELKLALEYIQSDNSTEWQTNAASAWRYGYGQYDAAAHHLDSYVPFGNYNGKAWQPPNKTPDARLDGVRLYANGGMPNKTFAAIRRWIAPRDGFISIDGTLIDGGSAGVRGCVHSSRLGELGNWTVAKGQSPTPVARIKVSRGELIDFIVQNAGGAKGDNFQWAPKITMEPSPDFPKDCILAWDAQKDFSGDPQLRRLNSWEKFAQVLLETNELTFVN